MRRTLAIATLAFSLLAAGCDDDDDGPTADGGRPEAGGDMAPAQPDAVNQDVARLDAADTGRAPDGGDAAADTAGDGGVDGAAAVDWNNCGAGSKPGVSAMEFCTKYMNACGFGTAMGRTAEFSFADLASCISRYTSYSDTPQKACAAYHLCVAASPAPMGSAANQNLITHCPHPAQAGGPCTLPAR
jgi:hypothetical protein